MITGKAREYDDFTHLKQQQSETVTKDNAQQELISARDETIKTLQKLDVNNITQVENLYLIVAKLTQAASFQAAITKAKRKNTSFADEIGSIGLDDVSPILIDAFKDHPHALNLNKINRIDDLYKPSKEAWAALHARMELVANATKAYRSMNRLKNTVSSYKNHLESKLRDSKVNIPIKKIPEEAPPIVRKLIARYDSVLALEKLVGNKNRLGTADIQSAKSHLKKCIDNKPDWSERRFTQKLTDILSLGLKPLYRSLFSKEKDLQKTMDHSIESPKMRK